MQINVRFLDKRILKYFYEEKEWIERIHFLRKSFDYHKNVNILMFDSVDELSRFKGKKVPPWVIGTYEENSIIILDYKLWKDRGVGTFNQILVHELAHVIIHNSTKYPCPIWINEGMAMYFARQIVSDQDTEDICDFEDIYKIDFSNPNIYRMSSYVINLIITKYGIDNTILRLKTASEFYNDYIFGKDNVNKLLLQIRNSKI